MRWPTFTHDESGQRIAMYETRAASLLELRSDLPAMRATADEMAHAVAHLQMVAGKAHALQSLYGLNVLGDLHAAAISDLEQGRDVGAMILAQEGIRVAVDATYVFRDPEGDRMEAMIRRQFDVQRERLATWQRACPGDAQPGPWLERIEDLCRRSPWYAHAQAWPPFVARAEAAGLDSWIHPIFASASNASEAAAQQFIHAVECDQLPEPERSAALSYRVARGTADTLYVEAVALLLCANVLHQLALNAGDAVAVTVAESAKARMETLIARHDQLADAHVDDGNVYVGIRLTPS